MSYFICDINNNFILRYYMDFCCQKIWKNVALNLDKTNIFKSALSGENSILFLIEFFQFFS